MFNQVPFNPADRGIESFTVFVKKGKFTTNYGCLDRSEGEGVLALLFFPCEDNVYAGLGDIRDWFEMGNPLKYFKIIAFFLFFFFPWLF